MRGILAFIGLFIGLVIGFIPVLISVMPDEMQAFFLITYSLIGFLAGFAFDKALMLRNEVKVLREHNNERWETIDRLECEKHDLEKEIKRYQKREKRNRKLATEIDLTLLSSALGMLGNLFNPQPEPEIEPEPEFEPKETDPETE